MPTKEKTSNGQCGVRRKRFRVFESGEQEFVFVEEQHLTQPGQARTQTTRSKKSEANS